MFEIGSEVARKDDLSIIGIVRESLGDGEYRVFFNNQTITIDGKYLVPRTVKTLEDEYNLIASGDYGDASALNELIVQEKMSGRLTNIFYSMHFGNTDFYPHQFKPVMKFIESMTDRLLIADEVGLGKTIEALYIWKELQVRDQARRLVIFCPAILTTKWQHDMAVYFSMDADIVNADTLADELQKGLSSVHMKKHFMYICSMESLRIQFKRQHSKLRNLLEIHQDEQTLFDLTIFDEAHYMRNPSTSSFKIATMVRDCTESMLLLSATPIQTSSRNLYTLLQLIAPEQFDDIRTFEHFISRNTEILSLMNVLQESNRPSRDVLYAVSQAQTADIVHPKLLAEISTRFKEEPAPSLDERITFAHRVDQQSYLSSYISRSRKAEVFEDSVKRDSQTVTFALSPFEYNQYTKASKYLEEIYGKTGIFAIIIKQRILASCLPVGIQNFFSKLSEEDIALFLQEQRNDEDELQELSIEEVMGFADFETLKEADSKYRSLVDELHSSLQPIAGQNKVIIFTGFRLTGNYLADRLREDDFAVSYIHGGMGNRKYETIDQFRTALEPRILLSTEVGSEGIDLQFCDTVINYDLPWNPMRIEQRIGRVDRIGQKSERIKIRNVICRNTIEDRVLERLYAHIKLFENTIGDLEEILGTEVEELIIDLWNKELTDEEIDTRILVNEKVQAITHQLKGELQAKAPSLASAGQFILQSIKQSDTQKHYITPEDVFSFVNGHLQEHSSDEYRLQPHQTDPHCYKIFLPQEFKRQFRLYCNRNPDLIPTQLTTDSSHLIYCYFNKVTGPGLRLGSKHEVIDIEHPLVKFIISEKEQETEAKQKCSVIHLHKRNLPEHVQVDNGLYTYYIELWEIQGALRNFELKYFIIPHSSNTVIDGDRAETFVTTAAQEGYQSISYLSSFQEALAIEQLTLLLTYCRGKRRSFDEEYSQRMSIYREQREQFINLSFDTKIQRTQETLKQLRTEGKSSVLRMYEGRIKKLESQKLDNLAENAEKQITSTYRDIAVGLIFVE